MSKYLKFFTCRLDTHDLIDSKIMRIITRILGEEPSEDTFDGTGRFVTYGELVNSNTVVYRILLTDEDISMLHNQINEIGVDFDEKFVRDYRHFHITLYKEINDNNDVLWEYVDEGTAYEKEDDSWDIYYDAGSLQNYLETNGEHLILKVPSNDEGSLQYYVVTNGHLILKVPNNEIKSLEDIKERFKKWVDEQKATITQKYFIDFPRTILNKDELCQ